MTEKDQIINEALMKVSRSLNQLGVKEISFIEPDIIQFFHKGYSMELQMKAKNDNGRRGLG